MPESEFLTKAELAKMCRCSERTIDQLLEGGDAPPVTKLSTRRIIFPATSAREWLANRTVGKNHTAKLPGAVGDGPAK